MGSPFCTLCRVGRSGLAVSGKTAAAAAVDSVSQAALLPSAGKKRKTKPVASSPDPAQKKGKKRKVADAAAEETPVDENTPDVPKTGSAKRGRPPRPPLDETATPTEQAHKLKLKLGTSEASALEPVSAPLVLRWTCIRARIGV